MDDGLAYHVIQRVACLSISVRQLQADGALGLRKKCPSLAILVVGVGAKRGRLDFWYEIEPYFKQNVGKYEIQYKIEIMSRPVVHDVFFFFALSNRVAEQRNDMT